MKDRTKKYEAMCGSGSLYEAVRNSAWWLLRCIFLVGALAFSGTMKAAKAMPSFYKQWSQLSSAELITKGYNFSELHNQPDSALICFSIVEGRSRNSSSPEDRKQAEEAYNGMWYVYYFFYYDYAKGYEALTKALQLCRKYNDNQARTLFNLACMYFGVAEPSRDQVMGRQAFRCFKQAFNEARKIKAGSILFNSFCNMVTLNAEFEPFENLQSELDYLLKNYSSSRNPIYQYAFLLYDAQKALDGHQYDKALRLYQRQLVLMSSKKDKNNERYNFIIHSNIARVWAAQHEYEKAIQALVDASRIAERENMIDGKMEVYKSLADYYRLNGQTSQSVEYQTRYLNVKDSVLNCQQLVSANEFQFIDKMQQLDTELQHSRQRSRNIVLVLLIFVVLSALTAIYLVIMARNNRRLTKKNQSLYEKNVQLLATEELLRKERDENLQLKNHMGKEKYQGSPLDDDNKQDLGARIQTVLESNEEIFNADFSIERLSELVDSRYKYVSQVINETFQCNFNALLNKYRIKEACKRLGDTQKYGQLTISAIAESVGFRSVAGFRTVFRNAVGMTPSEYQRMAMSQQKQKGQ